MNQKEMKQIANLVASEVINLLVQRGLVVNGAGNKSNKSAYSKTESLLYSYNSFRKTVEQKLQEIEEIKLYGVPSKSKSITTYCGNTGGTPQGIVLPEISVENAVQQIQDSMVDTLRAIELVDNGLALLKNDLYYGILPMRYFEGRTQEDIAEVFGVSQVTISNNKSRLIKELSMILFPKQTIEEMIN